MVMIAFSFAATLNAQKSPEQKLDDLFLPSRHLVYVAAHRGGDWRNDPENSIQSLKRAQTLGVDIVEMDLKQTKDGKLVLMHDKTIDRTTTGKGLVSEHTFEEIQQFKLRAATNHPTSYGVPTFTQELIAAEEGRVILDVDTGWDFFPLVLQEVDRNHARKRVILNLTPNTALDQFEKLNGELPVDLAVMVIVEMSRPDAKQIIQSYKAHKRTIVQCIFSDDQLAIVRHVTEVTQSTPIWMNGLWPEQNGGHDDDRAADLHQEDQSWGWLISHGARVLQTDRPRELRNYLQAQTLGTE